MIDFIKTFFRAQELKANVDRLEAFLSAIPGEYCGFGEDGTIAYSAGFLEALELKEINSTQDLARNLDTMDSALFENKFQNLKQTGTPFRIEVSLRRTDKVVELYGNKGSALEGHDIFYVIWAKDISQQKQEIQFLISQKEEYEYELKKFMQAMDNMPLLAWMRDAQGDLLWCNSYYADVLDQTPASVVAEQIELFATPVGDLAKLGGEEKTVRFLSERALESGKEQGGYFHCVLKGNRRYVYILEKPLADPVCTFGIMQDFTSKEELELEHRHTLSAHKALLEELKTAIGIFGPDQCLRFYNSSFAILWDLDSSWLDKHPKLGDIMEKLREARKLPEQADFRKFKQSWLEMFTDLISPYDEMMHLPDGSALRMLVVPHPRGGIMLTFEDVTSRLELESSYNTLIAVQKETLDNLTEGVAVYGGDGRMKLSNPAFGELWGLYPEDLHSEPHITDMIEKMLARFDKSEWQDLREVLLRQGLDREVNSGRLVFKNDSLIDYACVPLPDGGVMVTYVDVTDKVRIERALREKNAALEAAEKLKLDFLANVSYQLRTPLNAIMGFTDMLDYEYFGSLNTRQKEYTGNMKEAGIRLKETIDNILDLASIEAGTLDLELSEFSVAHMMDELADLVTEWARQAGIEITMTCPKNIGKYSADKRRLKQALLNLIRNAINYTPAHGKIRLSASRKAGSLVLEVEDTGIGISEEDKERIFEPFERNAVRNANRYKNGVSPSSGTGLGLSLVRRIVRLHQGIVKLDSQLNVGTKVSILLPLETQKK